MYDVYPITFISEADLIDHVKKTITEYGKKLEPYDIVKFNSNIIDPIKLIFDKMVYQSTWQEIVKNEIYRQRDKSNNNAIGYFHQRIFQYMANCVVPDNGKKGGWDVIYTNPDGITIEGGDIVHTIYVEMKNKHNTMNDAASANLYMKCQNQLLKDDDCCCMLVEAIATKSQNIVWVKRGNKHKRIRRVSMDKFYSIITGQKDAFYQICLILPDIIEKVIADAEVIVPNDTVYKELEAITKNKHISMAMATYLLGFSTYIGFN